MRHRHVQVKLLVAVVGASAAFLVALGVVGVRETTGLMRDSVYTGALDRVALEAKDIERFFAEHAEIVQTVMANPTMLRWFEEYDRFRRPLDGDQTFEGIRGYFRALVDKEPAVLSVFFATESTAEYFRESGRVEREGYNPKTRWWWAEALAEDALYVSPPGVDAGTGDLVVTVQTTVHAADGRLLGVGGVDVLLGTLGDIVRGIDYQGVGDAFLIDARSRIVYFPQLEVESPGLGPLSTTLEEIDVISPESGGFSSLSRAIASRGRGLEHVHWLGQERIVVFIPVEAEVPRFRWTLGLMVPEEVIATSIQRTRLHTAMAILIALLSIAGLGVVITNRIILALRDQDRRRADQLTEANQKLLEADRMKSQFLATMSHELRTPLNSIIGFSQVLRSRLGADLDPRMLKFLDNIHASGEHLLAMISDILDLSKIEAGKMEFQPETLDAAEVLDGVCSIVRGTARERGITLTTACDDPLPAVVADPVRVKQILFNLLSNAVKFSPEGSEVRVEGRHLPGGDSPLGVDSLMLVVIDHGIGIAEEDLEVIFDPFRQVIPGDGRRQEGTGLGLALVKRLVELHHGEIAVDSVPGEGSAFTVVLPLRYESSGQYVAVPYDDVKPEGAGLPVLVVEDDDVAFARIHRDLASRGYRVVRSSDGADAVELARALSPAAVVLDIILPAADGWDVLRQLRGLRETRSIPVIIVSVLDNHELGLALGADDYFTKPVDGGILLRRLDELVPSTLDRRPRLVLIDDDRDLHLLLDEILGTRGYRLDHAMSGREGIRLVQERPPDLVVLDLMMEEMDGFEVARRLRDEPGVSRVPIVVFTVRELGREERERLRGRIEALVRKDGDGTAKLVATIRHLLEPESPPRADGESSQSPW